MRLQQYINESINDKGIFKACFMAGTPGSGKSFVISKIKGGDIEPRVVNVDRMNEYLKAFTQEQRNVIQDKVNRVTQNQLALYLNGMLPLWLDGTASKVSEVKYRKNALEEFGYDTAMIWVNTSVETAIKRAQKRERKVDPEIIEILYDNIQNNKPLYKSMFPIFVEVNNDDGELTDKVILKVYRKMSGYFNTPVKNPKGKEIIGKGCKYLIDCGYTMNDIKSAISGWY